MGMHGPQRELLAAPPACGMRPSNLVYVALHSLKGLDQAKPAGFWAFEARKWSAAVLKRACRPAPSAATVPGPCRCPQTPRAGSRPSSAPGRRSSEASADAGSNMSLLPTAEWSDKSISGIGFDRCDSANGVCHAMNDDTSLSLPVMPCDT